MDFQIADRHRKRRTRRLIFAGGGVAALAALLILLGRIGPGAPEVNRSVVWTGVVERGELVRQVRGPGSLQVPPEQIRWLAAETRGRVEERRVLPGTPVEADTVLLVLSNPELAQQTRDAELQLRAQEAELRRLLDQTRSDLLEQQNAAGQLASSSTKARRLADANQKLFEAGFVGELIHRRSQVSAEELKTRHALEEERLFILSDSSKAQLTSKEATVARFRAVLALRRRQLAALTVRAGRVGILLEAPVEVGEEVNPGQNLARVADPQELKAVLRIAETQARDIEPGQSALVDTRNGVIEGVVSRVDPGVRDGTVAVDIRLAGRAPPRRPSGPFGGRHHRTGPDPGHAPRRPARLRPAGEYGRALPDCARRSRPQCGFRWSLGGGSVNRIEVLGGLAEGDEIILSDTSAWDTWDAIRLR